MMEYNATRRPKRNMEERSNHWFDGTSMSSGSTPLNASCSKAIAGERVTALKTGLWVSKKHPVAFGGEAECWN